MARTNRLISAFKSACLIEVQIYMQHPDDHYGYRWPIQNCTYIVLLRGSHFGFSCEMPLKYIYFFNDHIHVDMNITYPLCDSDCLSVCVHISASECLYLAVCVRACFKFQAQCKAYLVSRV